MYHIVYDKKGEMFEVPAYLLSYLIVELGWTFWHPDNPPKSVFNT